MWGEALDWLLHFLMMYGLVHCKPLIMKPLSQPLVLAEMPPLYPVPLDGTLPHNLIDDVTCKNVHCQNGCQSQTLWLS